jgi:oligopeptide transport system substrate-binding protein
LLFSCIAFSGCGRNCCERFDGNILRIGNGTEPQTLDPQLAGDLQQIAIARALFEGLVLLDESTLRPIPGAAASWDRSEDGRTYTFHLRPDGRWSDGSPLTAEDFAYGLRRILTANLASPTAELLFPLLGAKAFYNGRAEWDSVGVAVADPLTLVLTLERPTPYFLSLLSHPAWSPIHRNCVEANGPGTVRDSLWTRPGRLISNGPYQLRGWRVGDRVSVEKNPFHRDSDGRGPDEIIFFSINDSETEQNAFKNGEIDVTNTIPPNHIGDLRRTDPDTVQEVESLGVFYYLLRCDRPPLNDIHLRRALAAAVDRRQLCCLLSRPERFAAGNLVPPGCGSYSYGGKMQAYDPELARRELERSTFGQSGRKALTLTISSGPQHRLIGQAVQEMWRKELGIDVKLCSEEWKSFLLTRRSGNFEVARGGWIGDFDDPTAFLDLFRTGAVNNFTRWGSADYDGALDAAERDPERRKRYLKKAEEILLDSVPIIALYFETGKHRVSPRVVGWKPNLLDYHLYQNLFLQDIPAKKRGTASGSD